MTQGPDRRAVTAAIAALLTSAGAPRRPAGLEALLAPADGPPMACAGVIARRPDGSLAMHTAVGAAGGSPFTLQRPFRVASVSKMVAASVFMTVALATGLDLDGDASQLVGFRLRHPAHPEVAITPRMLLAHTSGLRNGPSYPVPLGHRLAEAFTRGGRHFDDGGWFGPPQHRPGDWFAYADVNFALVAQMLERRACERFDVTMRTALFAPLGLDIGYNWSGVSQAKRARAAPAVQQVNGVWAPQVDAAVPPFPKIAFTRPADAPGLDVADYRNGDNGFVFSPQGGLRLSLADMDVLARLFAGGGAWKGRQVVSRAALAAMQARAWTFDPDRPNGETDNGLLQSYGLGCEAPLGRSGHAGDGFFGIGDGDWRGHFGDAYGWITALFWNRRDGRTLVYAVGGMPATGRPHAAYSSLTAPEELLIGLALRP